MKYRIFFPQFPPIVKPVLQPPQYENVWKRAFIAGFSEKVLDSSFLVGRTERLLLRNSAAHTMLSASKYVWAIRWRSEEPGHGYGKVEPKDLHRFRGCQLDGDLRRACAQFCEEPSFGLHRPGSRSRRHQRRSVAVHSFGSDGFGDPVSEMHSLRPR